MALGLARRAAVAISAVLVGSLLLTGGLWLQQHQAESRRQAAMGLVTLPGATPAVLDRLLGEMGPSGFLRDYQAFVSTGDLRALDGMALALGNAQSLLGEIEAAPPGTGAATRITVALDAARELYQQARNGAVADPALAAATYTALVRAVESWRADAIAASITATQPADVWAVWCSVGGAILLLGGGLLGALSGGWLPARRLARLAETLDAAVATPLETPLALGDGGDEIGQVAAAAERLRQKLVNLPDLAFTVAGQAQEFRFLGESRDAFSTLTDALARAAEEMTLASQGLRDDTDATRTALQQAAADGRVLAAAPDRLDATLAAAQAGADSLAATSHSLTERFHGLGVRIEALLAALATSAELVQDRLPEMLDSVEQGGRQMSETGLAFQDRLDSALTALGREREALAALADRLSQPANKIVPTAEAVDLLSTVETALGGLAAARGQRHQAVLDRLGALRAAIATPVAAWPETGALTPPPAHPPGSPPPRE